MLTDNGRTDGQPEAKMLSTYYCWRRHNKSKRITGNILYRCKM